jgi:hypothetical protein
MPRPVDCKPYTKLKQEEKYGELRKIETYVKKYSNDTGFDFNDISCNHDILLDIVERVEKRRYYFCTFHRIEMSEKYEAALYCFWITKLAPFFDQKHSEENINAKIAVHLFLVTISKLRKNKHPLQDMKFGKEYVYNLKYALIYQDVSKEALMLVADSLLGVAYLPKR